MKKVYLLITALCLTALTGCVKEDPYTLSEATIEVNLDTRSGATSEQQGDKIEDVMIWVFKGDDWGTLAGWRTYTPPTDAYAYTSLTLHIPVALCDDAGETYRLVAVLNQSTWGTVVDANGDTLTLDSETTYAELIGARFENSTLINQAIKDDKPGTPATMPASHWCDVEVTKEHTHANSQCATANLDVFRSVAKTQLFVTKTSNDFSLKITDVTVNSASAPAEGMVLSESTAKTLKATDATPDWFDGYAPTEFNTSFSQSLKNGESGFTTVSLPAAEGDPTETFVGSAFLYENADGFAGSYADYDYTTAPTGDGYYLTVNYTVDNEEKTGYIPLPAAVRNHDYQVHLTVDKSGANLELIITINEWNTVKYTYGQITIG